MLAQILCGRKSKMETSRRNPNSPTIYCQQCPALGNILQIGGLARHSIFREFTNRIFSNSAKWKNDFDGNLSESLETFWKPIIVNLCCFWIGKQRHRFSEGLQTLSELFFEFGNQLWEFLQSSENGLHYKVKCGSLKWSQASPVSGLGLERSPWSQRGNVTSSIEGNPAPERLRPPQVAPKAPLENAPTWNVFVLYAAASLWVRH